MRWCFSNQTWSGPRDVTPKIYTNFWGCLLQENVLWLKPSDEKTFYSTESGIPLKMSFRR